MTRSAAIMPIMMMLAVGCAETPRNVVATSAPTRPAEIDWTRPGTYTAADWTFEYSWRGGGAGVRGLQWGHLRFREFDLIPGNERINDFINTPWGRMYWAGTARHGWGYQGWEPEPVAGKPAGHRVVPGQILAMEIIATVFPVWRERLDERLDVMLAELPEHPVKSPLGELQPQGEPHVLESILRALGKVLKEAPEYAASDEDARLARRAVGTHGMHPVLKVDGRWVVAIDDGHPAADGVWAVYVVDAKTRAVLRSMSWVGYRTRIIE